MDAPKKGGGEQGREVVETMEGGCKKTAVRRAEGRTCNLSISDRHLVRFWLLTQHAVAPEPCVYVT